MVKPLTITFFGFAPLTYGGGYETYIIKLVERLSKEGHNINIITGDQIMSNIFSISFYQKLFEKRISKDDIKKDIPLVKICEYNIGSLMPMSKSFNNIRKMMRESDVIYTRNEIIDFLLINHFCRRYHPPIICGIHTSIIYLYRTTFVSRLHNMVYKKFIYRRLLDNCSKILTQNKFDTDLLSRYNIRKDKIIKLLPFVDTNFFHSIDIKKKDNKFNILFAGRLTEQKGIDLLCKSIEEMAKLREFNDMTFTIAGSGELEYMIKRLSKKYDNIKFLGFVPNKKLVELYNSHDVVVLPSRWETALKVVLEAQACGLPVIVSDIPGPSELIIYNKTGLIVEPENHDDISKNILRIFRLKIYNNVEYIKMRQESARNARKYSIDIVVDKLNELFYDSVKSNIY